MEETQKPLRGVAELYEKSLSDHGLTSKSVGWKDEASQLLRFDKLSQVIGAGGERFSVNDLGCGYAAMFDYLRQRHDARLSLYHGYDISDEMLAAAGQTVIDQRAIFHKASQASEEADYSFVSGTFNVKMDASDEAWTEHVKETLLQLAAQSRRGFAFNLLSTYVDWKQDNLFYADPLAFFDFCRRNISRYVSLLHDYPLYEWTILVSREKSTQ